MSGKTDNTISAAGGVAAGWASYRYLPSIVQRPYGRWILSECRKIPQAEHIKYYDAAKQAYETSGLKEKGVELIDLNSSNLQGVIKDTFEKSEKNAEIMKKNLRTKIYKFFNMPVPKEIKTKPQKPRPKWKYILFGPSREDKLKASLKNISEGNNASFHSGSNNVFVNKDAMGFSAFHEMGHAVNANSKDALKTLSIGRHFAAFAVPFLLAAALIKKRKPESSDEPRSTQRRKNFLKDNIGLITFGCMLPTVVEEGLASINGAKLAKKVLNPQEIKKLNITNTKAWSTYLLGATLVSICAQLAVKVKDRLVPPKQNQK